MHSQSTYSLWSPLFCFLPRPSSLESASRFLLSSSNPKHHHLHITVSTWILHFSNSSPCNTYLPSYFAVFSQSLSEFRSHERCHSKHNRLPFQGITNFFFLLERAECREWKRWACSCRKRLHIRRPCNPRHVFSGVVEHFAYNSHFGAFEMLDEGLHELVGQTGGLTVRAKDRGARRRTILNVMM